LQHRDRVAAPFVREQSRGFGDEPIQTLAVIETHQHRQLDAQRMKNAPRSLPGSAIADALFRESGQLARLAVQERFFLPGTRSLHEPAPR
jgi:hypothetical protein